MAPPRYSRSTVRVQRVEELPPGLVAALREEAPGLEDAIAAGKPAWWTHSVNLPGTGLLGRLLGVRSNLADPDVEHDVVLVLDGRRIVVVTWGEERGAGSLEVGAADASIARHPTVGLEGSASSDAGVAIHGFPSVQGLRGSFWLGLGPERAAEECVAALHEVVSS